MFNIVDGTENEVVKLINVLFRRMFLKIYQHTHDAHIQKRERKRDKQINTSSFHWLINVYLQCLKQPRYHYVFL